VDHNVEKAVHRKSVRILGETRFWKRALSKPVQARKIMKNFVILGIACFRSWCKSVIVKSHIRKLLS
jgi:hypothetical protein